MTNNRTLKTSIVASCLGSALAETRHTTSPDIAFVELAKRHGVPGTMLDHHTLAQAVGAMIAVDHVFDSEYDMATRAVRAVLTHAFGEQIHLSGEPLAHELFDAHQTPY